jgi:adenylate kinase
MPREGNFAEQLKVLRLIRKGLRADMPIIDTIFNPFASANKLCGKRIMEQQANIVLLGAPGAGKGTQAAFLVQRLAIPHISTGDMLRAARAAGTELGRKAAQYMDAGELVPDDIIVGVALERLAQPDCAQGFLLDGFPRTLPQAEALTEALGQEGRRIALALNLDADEAEIVRRLSSRRVCRGCGKIFSLAKKQVQEGGACPE